jgi:hypothetical protein
MALLRSVEQEGTLLLLLLEVVAALKDRQVFSRVRYAAVVDFFKVLIRSVEREGMLVLLPLEVAAVTLQFQVSISWIGAYNKNFSKICESQVLINT